MTHVFLLFVKPQPLSHAVPSSSKLCFVQAKAGPPVPTPGHYATDNIVCDGSCQGTAVQAIKYIVTVCHAS